MRKFPLEHKNLMFMFMIMLMLMILMLLMETKLKSLKRKCERLLKENVIKITP